jgi:hypothetical protein
MQQRLACVINRPLLRASTRNSSNSIGVRCTSSPSRRTLRAARSTRSPSATRTASSGAPAVRRSTAFRRATSSRGLNGLTT